MSEAASRRERIMAALRPHLVGLGLAFTYVVVLARTAKDIGFARDEGFYFHAARSYAGWFNLLLTNRAEALTRGAIDQAWGVNHEHPSLMKSAFALSWLFLHQRWHLVAHESLSFRLPGMLMAGLGLWVTYLFGYRAHSHRAGLMAALLLALMPRLFYHSHLDCFDIPVVTMWVVVLYAYWRSTDGSLGWALATGFLWGLALETKHNAWFVPFLVVTHYVLTKGRDIAAEVRRGRVPIPLSLVSMAVLGPLVFWALWPWMWFDFLRTPDGRPGRLSEYFGFHLNHAYYNMEWLGVNYFRPPFPRTYAWGMMLFTVPGITLLLGAIGIVLLFPKGLREMSWVASLVPRALADRVPALARLRDAGAPRATDDLRGTATLLGMGFLVPLAPWFSPRTPIFGGTKHWAPAYPFLALMAGVAFAYLAKHVEARFRDRAPRPWVPAAALGLVLTLPPLWQTAHSHPFGLSNYTPLAGGAPGAADLGLNRQFWGFTTGSLAPWFNANAPQGASVFIHDTTYESWEMLQRDGTLRDDLHAVWQPAEADYSIVHHELHMNEVDYQIWTAYQSPDTVEVLTYDGVPIVSVYQRPPRPQP